MYYEVATPQHEVSARNPQLSKTEHQEINEIIKDGIEAAEE